MENPTACSKCDKNKRDMPFDSWFAKNGYQPCSVCGGRGNTPPKSPATPFIDELPQVWPQLKGTSL